jgi:eukaryotic-like serine/threonine-protein kinase
VTRLNKPDSEMLTTVFPAESVADPKELPAFLAEVAGLPIDLLVPRLWDDQRRRWEAGERASAESYLHGLPASVAEAVEMDLIYGEVLLREELGEGPPLSDEYRRRFPRRAEQIDRQLALEAALSGARWSAVEPASESANLFETTYADKQIQAAETKTHGHAPAKRDGEPTEIAGYRIIGVLGEGGQGKVYRAVHPKLGRDVVIKVGRHATADSASDALAQEGKILAQLDHPALARVYDLCMHRGRVCLVMEFVRGRDLEQDVRSRPRDPRAAANLVAKVARALGSAHRRGICHRDVKPANILIDDVGEPRLIDFGLALVEDAWNRGNENHGLSGTVSYMAPEQARAEAVGPQSDVFSLGGVLLFLLTGKPPYCGTQLREVLDRAGRGEWDRKPLGNPSVPRRIRDVVEKAMAANAADRYPTATEFADALESLSRRRRWLPVLAGGVVAAALAALLVVGFARGPSTPLPAPLEIKVARRIPLSLEVRVGRVKKYLDLVDCVPINEGDPIRVEAVAPAGLHAMLLDRSSSGKIAMLAGSDAGNADRPLTFPAVAGKAVKIAGPAGNELILLCARGSEPPKLDDLRGLLDECAAWPMLPADSVLSLSPSGAKVLQKGRDLGSLVDRADPEAEVLAGLRRLGTRLEPVVDHFEAIVFFHGERP